MKVHAFADHALGNTSYLVECGGGIAVSIDPRRDVDELVARADALGVRIVASLETHLHADFVSGSRELAARTGAEVIAAPAAALGFDHRTVEPGAPIALGDAEFRVLDTPGHTPEHVAFVLAAGGAERAVFSGGSLIAGGAARTDLTGAERTEELARAQFRSLRRIARLPDSTELYPTHGAGSFCSWGTPTAGATTVGAERGANPLLRIDDERAAVGRFVGSFGTFPPYFLHLRDVNRAPVLLGDLEPARALPPRDAGDAVRDGAWLLDARDADRWAEEHATGSISIPLRSPAFCSSLGWVVPFGERVVLIAGDEERAEAFMLARRIGYDRLLGWVDGDVRAWRAAGLPIAAGEAVTVVQARARMASGAIALDVRQGSEWERGRIPGARHIELGDLIAGKHPDGSPDVITYCNSGNRSTTASSLLERRGFRAATLAGGLGAWKKAGLPVEG